MAELERAERNDEGRAREWMARALNAAPDPAWTADGYVSDRWLPASPVTGRLDAFEWRVPLTGMLSAPVIEPEPPAAAPARSKPQPPPAMPEATPLLRRRTSRCPSTRRRATMLRNPRPEPKPEPIIPLVHAPDDPGPEVVEESEAPVERRERRLAQDFRVSAIGLSLPLPPASCIILYEL